MTLVRAFCNVAVIKMFTSTADRIAVFKVWLTLEKPLRITQLEEFPSRLQSVLAYPNSLFWFCGNFTALVLSQHSHQPLFQQQQEAVFSEKALKNSLCTTSSTPNIRQSWQKLLNIVEHSVTKELGILLRS